MPAADDDLLRSLDVANEAARSGNLATALGSWMTLEPQLRSAGLLEEATAVTQLVCNARDAIERAREEGNTCFKAKKWADARKAYTRALDFCPSDASLLTNRAAAALRAGDARAALVDASTAVAHNKEWVKGHFRRGQALVALGDLSGAAAAHEEAARLGAGTDASKELSAAAKAARAAADEEAKRTGGSKQPVAAKIGDEATDEEQGLQQQGPQQGPQQPTFDRTVQTP